MVLLERDTRGMGLSDWLGLRTEILAKTSSADVVICLNHGAVLAGGLILGHHSKRRLVGIFEWSRQYPSRRRGLKTRMYAFFLKFILKRYSAVCSPVSGMRDFYAPTIRMLPILYPLPYADFNQTASLEKPDQDAKVLFIGADIQRKGGDLLLSQWQRHAPLAAHLSFVTPSPPEGDWPNVRFLHDIKPFTPEHRDLLESHTIFVLPSHRESYGFAALEALNFGHVVVTSASAGIAGLVAEAGGIVGKSPEDAIRLAMELVGQPAEIARRRAACRSFMAGYHQRFQDMMRAALEGSSPT